MTIKKDKQKVLGEVFDDARVHGFLDIRLKEGVNTDFRLLERAYRGMNIDNFKTFLHYFKQEGHDINAKNPHGKTMIHTVNEHRQSAVYVEALRDNGASL